MAGVNSGAFSGTAAAVGTVGNTAGKAIVFRVVTSGAETVSITGLIAGSVVTDKIMCYSLVTGALHSTVDMADGVYYIPQVVAGSLIFLGSGAADTKTITFLVSSAD
jgi:hypothetical protein